MQQAQQAKLRGELDWHRREPDFNPTTRKIQGWVSMIADKVPVINQLERKIGMLEGLDPVLENIVSDLNAVTDFRSLDFFNHIWDMKNAAQFGSIENSDLPMPNSSMFRRRSARPVANPYMVPGIDGRTLTDQLTDDLAPIKQLISDNADRLKTTDETNNILKTHIDKLKTIVGKTETEKKTEAIISQTKHEAAEKIHEEQLKVDKEVEELKAKVAEAEKRAHQL